MSGPRHTLESLKKEAKRWLHALRDNTPGARERLLRAFPTAPASPSLRDVQHAVAREHGFPGWAGLKQRLAEPPLPAATDRARFDEMAEALLDAYRSGTPAAMERHWALTWHRRAWGGMRTYVQLDLGRLAGTADLDADITLDDARLLVAREQGFESWDAMLEYFAALPAPTSVHTVRPIELEPRWSSRDWGAVIARLGAAQATGLDAHGQMTDDMLAQLPRLEQITSLRLSGSRLVSDQGVRHLARLPRLRHLDLTGTGVTDRGLEVLRALPELENVSLAWTPVTDDGMAHLTGLENLRSVNLAGTRTGDGALVALAGKARLHELRTGHGVSDTGIAVLHEYPVFKRWRGGESVMGLTSYDAGPNYLMLRGPFTDHGLAQLEGLDGLFALNLDDSQLRVTEHGLATLVGLPRLGWLACDAKDAAMPYIARMSRLRFLGCQDTTAGDKGFTALSASPSIEYIWGRRCYNLGTRGFTALAGMPALKALSVSCKNVGDAGVAALPSFPALRELMPMDVPDAGYRHIGRCARLESLVLMYCRETGDEATSHITGLDRLARYFASYTRITDRTPELLAGMASLEEITFSACAGLTDAGIAHLARLPRLRKLDVSGGGITARVGEAFPAGVEVQYGL